MSTDQRKNLMDKRLVKPATIDGLWIMERPVWDDDRGFFHETFRLQELAEVIGYEFVVKQWNHSRSQANVLRGLHAEPWNKLTYCVRGSVLVAVVDIRPSSPTFGKFETFEMGESHRQALFVSSGFAHGFYAKEGSESDYCYLVDQEYKEGSYQALAWDDPDVGINWPTKNPELSEKDKHNPRLRELFPEKFK